MGIRFNFRYNKSEKINIIIRIAIYIIMMSLSFAKESDLENLTFHDYKAININGTTINMEKYKGKKVLVVNVASKCGFTPQYAGLQKLHEEFSDSLFILGFPSNDFFWQEPGSNQNIINFCKSNYGVTFPMFEKIHVKGKKQHPIYKWLSDSRLNGWNDDAPSWNFCKYLIDEEGKLLEYYKSQIEPTDTLITQHLSNGKTTPPKEN